MGQKYVSFSLQLAQNTVSLPHILSKLCSRCVCKHMYVFTLGTQFDMNFYLIILFNLIIPKLLSLVGGPLSGNGCGSPNISHIIFVISLLLVALFTQVYS